MSDQPSTPEQTKPADSVGSKTVETTQFAAPHAPRKRSAYNSYDSDGEMPADLLKAMEEEEMDENPFVDADDGVVVIIRKTPSENQVHDASNAPIASTPTSTLFSPTSTLSNSISAFGFDVNPPADAPGPVNAIPATRFTSISAFGFDHSSNNPSALAPGPSNAAPAPATPFKEPLNVEERRRRQSARDREMRALRSATKRRPSRRGDDSD